MSLFNILNTSGSAMAAQSTRLNTVASNLANAEVAASSPDEAYRARYPVFRTILDRSGSEQRAGGVEVSGIVESRTPPRMEYMPGHPLANEDGYVFFPAISTVEEMANMMSASRSYQNDIDAMNTIKQLMLRTLQLGER